MSYLTVLSSNIKNNLFHFRNYKSFCFFLSVCRYWMGLCVKNSWRNAMERSLFHFLKRTCGTEVFFTFWKELLFALILLDCFHKLCWGGFPMLPHFCCNKYIELLCSAFLYFSRKPGSKFDLTVFNLSCQCFKAVN